jgi:nitric oxide reductase subunit C
VLDVQQKGEPRMLKRSTLILSLLVVVAMLVLAACGGGATPAPSGGSQPAASGAGNADSGKKLFGETVIASAGSPGCVTCHSLEKGKTLVGPSMAGIATEVTKDLKDPAYKGTAKTVEEFLRESIVDPDVWLTAGFSAGIMPKTLNKLSEQELNDLIAYLLTLK